MGQVEFNATLLYALQEVCGATLFQSLHGCLGGVRFTVAIYYPRYGAREL